MSLPWKTVEEALYHWGQVDPDTEAFVSIAPTTFERRALTRHELHVLVRKFAASLRHEGINKGDVVCVALSNCLERVVVDMGVICSGAIALNGQVLRADGEDLIQTLISTKAKAVVVDPELCRGAWSILKNYVPELDAEVSCTRLPHLRRIISCRHSEDPAVDFFSRLHSYNRSLQRAHALTSDVALIWTTSGSTGYSKLVPQTHANLLHVQKQVAHITGLKSGDKFLNCAPLGWGGGFPLWFLAVGCTRVFVDTSAGPPRDMPQMLWECVQREKCVYALSTPMYIHAVMNQPQLWQGEGKWRPTVICLIGQPMKKVVVSAVGKLCQYIDVCYGSTECGVITSVRLSDSETYSDGVTGSPTVDVKLRVVDEQLQDVAQGQIGEILVQSPSVSGIYLDNETAAQRTFIQGGWCRTDDVGYIQPDGQLLHLGRRSEAITRGAYLCYPGWLEALLRRAPGVRDVCVVPVPDPVLHHEICACVVPSEEAPAASDFEASLKTFAESLLLTHPEEAQHMTPKYYVIVESLPLTATGKISRKELIAIAVQKLRLCSE